MPESARGTNASNPSLILFVDPTGGEWMIGVDTQTERTRQFDEKRTQERFVHRLGIVPLDEKALTQDLGGNPLRIHRSSLAPPDGDWSSVRKQRSDRANR